MANRLIYSFLNPVQLFDPNPTLDERYRTRDFIDNDFPETILPWEENVEFAQTWQNSDTIFLQLQTNVGPVAFILKDYHTEQVVDTLLFTQGAQNVNDPTLYIYELSAPLTGYPEGCYYAEVTFGASPIVFTLKSGKIIIAEDVEDTVLMEYQHFEFREEMLFETGLLFQLRVPATLKYQKTANKSTSYEDQVLNVSTLRNVPYRLWKLFTGGSEGIPDWLGDKVSRIIGCSTLILDGKYFTKPQDSELEPKEEENYPLRGWSVDLRERYNRGSREYENEEPLDGVIEVMVNVDSKGFGNSNSGSQTAITDIN